MRTIYFDQPVAYQADQVYNKNSRKYETELLTVNRFQSIIEFTDLRGNEFHLAKLGMFNQYHIVWKPANSEKYSITKLKNANGKSMYSSQANQRFFRICKNLNKTQFSHV